MAALMGRMAGGDRDVLYQLSWDFGDSIAAAMRAELRRLGAVRVGAEDVDGLVLDACANLYDRAGSWDPSHGALPWTWARYRLQAIAVAFGSGSTPTRCPSGGRPRR